jgi:hypothetical protein
VSWTRTTDTESRVEWDRADGYARVVARQTATGNWAVSLDRLEQAPEGETYAHETVDAREEAVSLAETWTDEHDSE